MKKILTILGTLTLTVGTSASVIACGPKEEVKELTDLSSLVENQDLGEIKNQDISFDDAGIGEIDTTVYDLIKTKNPKLTDEVLKHLDTESLNNYKVDGTNVSMTLVPKANDKTYKGNIKFSFILEAAKNKSLFDSSYLKKDNLGKINFEKGSSQSIEAQVLKNFFKENPDYHLNQAGFEVAGIYSIDGNNFSAVINLKLSSSVINNYDLRLGSSIKVIFSIK